MEISRNLSKNLRAYQAARGSTLAEFSTELGVPKSTLRAVMREGNTTLDIAMRLANGLGVTLDVLLYDEALPEKLSLVQSILRSAQWFDSLSPEKQVEVADNMARLMETLMK